MWKMELKCFACKAARAIIHQVLSNRDSSSIDAVNFSSAHNETLSIVAMHVQQ